MANDASFGKIIWLPLQFRPCGLPISSDDEVSSDQVSLLIVEDEPRYLESTRLLLAPHFQRIDTTMTGAQAVNWLAQRNYDLVLLDLRLLDTSGHEVMAFFREKHPTICIIAKGKVTCGNS